MEAIHADLITERLLLRSFRTEDQPFVFHGLSHPEVVRYYGVRYQSLEDTRLQMEWFESLRHDGTGIWWLIADHADQVAYGAIGINSIHPLHRKAELGFWLLPEYWGKGYIPEAGEKVLQYAFEELKLHRIEALVEVENEASKKVLQKLRFHYEGTMQECEWKDGRWVSLEMYGRLKKP